MKIPLIKQLFYKYLLAFLALFLLGYYIWVRFLRERLPRDIPFKLTFISFIILSIICLSYVFIILKIRKEKLDQLYYIKHFTTNPNQSKVSYFLALILSKIIVLFKPLFLLQHFILVEFKFDLFFINVFSYLIEKYKLYDEDITLKMLLMFDFYPKIILFSIFILDIFVFKQLNIFYSCLLLGIIPMLYNFVIYNITVSLEILIKNLEENYYVKLLTTREEEQAYIERNGFQGPAFMIFISDLDFDDNRLLNARYFITAQVQNIIFECNLYKYTCIETPDAREDYAKKHNLELPPLRVLEPESDYISKKLFPYFFEHMEKAIYLQTFLEVQKDLTKPSMQRKYYLYLYLGYLIGWIYILVLSIPSLNLQYLLENLNLILNLLKVNLNSSMIEEPFSQTIIEEIKNDND